MKNQNKKRWLAAGACVLLLLAVVLGVNLLRDRPSKYIGGPVDGYVLVNWQQKYPLGTKVITVRVANEGTESGGMNHPFLEEQRDGKWYRMDRDPVNMTANLLGVGPGTEEDLTISLEGYDLKPGNYRAVFVFTDGERYISAPFTLTEN